MMIYFADRAMNILGQASDVLNSGYRIDHDSCVSEIEHGTETLTFDIYFEPESRLKIDEMSYVGNYILRHTGRKDQYKLYTIIDSDMDVNERSINIYAEDGGLDLLNETAGPYDPEKEIPIKDYVNKYLADTGFKIGKNEIGNGTKKRIVFDNDETVTARLLSIASTFEAEITYSYTISGLRVTGKYIDIYKRIGSEKPIELRTNREIDNINVKRSIANLCTGIYPIGGSPDGALGFPAGKNAAGETLYTWIMYADNVSGSEGFENSPGSHNFIGVAMNKKKYLASENYKDFKWYRLTYDKVIVVPHGQNGFKYRDKEGSSSDSYMWVRFAEDEEGKGMNVNSGKYIGIAKNKKESSPSSDPKDYSWDLYYGYDAKNLYLRTDDKHLADGRYCHWRVNGNQVGFVVDFSATDPPNSTDYTWSEINENPLENDLYLEFDWHTFGVKSYDESGNEVVGKYLWIRFGGDNDDNQITDVPKSAKYIGFSYDHDTITATNSYSRYDWHPIGGDVDKMTLDGYTYKNGDYYVEDGTLYSKSATAKWSRYKSSNETGRTAMGAIVRRISYDEGNPDELLKLALEDLKKYKEPEVNYEVSIHYLPEDVNIGDTINIVDDAGLLYVSARLLQIDRSEVDDTTSITLGDFLIKDSGINERVEQLATDFANWAKANPALVYTWTVYADDEHGLNITTNPANRKYMGIAYNQAAKMPDLDNPELYTWSKIQGDDGLPGADAITIEISSSEGTTFKNSGIATTLTATVRKGQYELSIAGMTALGYVLKWYKNETVVATGVLSYSVSVQDDQATYSARLETT